MKSYKPGKEETKKLADIEKLQSTRQSHSSALKQVQSLLKKYPQNPEAIAWNAFYTYTNDPKTGKQLAIDTVKQAIRADMTNPKVWKISGLLYKEMQDFASALQSFSTAYKRSPKDTTLLNDLCSFEFYERHYEQFRIDITTLFKEHPTPWNIMRYVFALVYTDQIESAIKFLIGYEAKWKIAGSEEEQVFQSECALFHAMLLIKIHKYSEALEHMATMKTRAIIRDTVKMLELQLECLRHLDQKADVITTLHQLIKMYPDDGKYFQIYESLFDSDELLSGYQELQPFISRSDYIRVRILELMDIKNTQFSTLLRAHLTPLLSRGAPSAYMSIEELSPEKIDMALDIVRSLELPLCCVPIVHLFAAQVYGFRGQIDEAIRELDAGIAHTPTVLELYQWKARFLMMMGRNTDALASAKIYAEGDPGDRNANLIYVKALFACGHRFEAVKIATLFSTDDSGSSLLFDTQFNSLYAKYAISSIRCRDLEAAQILNQGILRHFEEFRKGIFAYINWASRKPRAFYEMNQVIDSLECETHFGRAAQWVFRLALHDNTCDKMKATAMWTLRSNKPEALAYAAIMFCKLNMPAQAVKCYRRIVDTPFLFIAKPSIDALMKTIDSLNPIVKEVLVDECPVVDRDPTTFDELVSLAKGYAAIKDDRATSTMERAVDTETVSWKRALHVYMTTIVDGIGTSVADKLKAKYPDFEFEISSPDTEKPPLPTLD